MSTHATYRTLFLAAAAMSLAAFGITPGFAQVSPRKLVVVMVQSHDPLYVDIDSIERRGNIVQFKYVLDVRAPTEDGQGQGQWRSNEITASIDCSKKRVSVRRLTAYPGPRATGTPTAVHSFNAADVKPAEIPPQSTFAYLEAHLCRAG